MVECLFCKIIQGDLPCDQIYQDDQVIIFKDIHPKAKAHWLVAPKLHLENLQHVNESHKALLGHMAYIIPTLAKEHKLGDFRVVSNNGPGAGQIVFHMHWHVLAGAANLAHF